MTHKDDKDDKGGKMVDICGGLKPSTQAPPPLTKQRTKGKSGKK